MKEELTTKMHSEFTVSRETDIKHRAWVALGLIGSGFTVEKAIKYRSVTVDDLKKHLEEYNRQFNEKVVLKVPKCKP